jgi:hypothetical protein
VANRVHLVGKTFFREGGVKVDPKWREGFRAGRDLKSGNMFGSKDGFDFEIYNAYMDFGLAWNPRSWEIVDGVVASLQQETRQKGSPLAILLFPRTHPGAGQLRGPLAAGSLPRALRPARHPVPGPFARAARRLAGQEG